MIQDLKYRNGKNVVSMKVDSSINKIDYYQDGFLIANYYKKNSLDLNHQLKTIDSFLKSRNYN